MKNVRRGLAIAILLLMATAHQAFAQVYSSNPSITLNANLSESLGIGLSNSTVNFSLSAGSTAGGDSTVDISTSWALNNRSTIQVYGYFSDPSAALSGPSNIPASSVQGYVPSAGMSSYTSFSSTSPFNGSGGSLLLVSQGVSGSSSGSRTDTLYLQLDLTAQSGLPSGSYSGTLYIEAYAF